MGRIMKKSAVLALLLKVPEHQAKVKEKSPSGCTEGLSIVSMAVGSAAEYVPAPEMWGYECVVDVASTLSPRESQPLLGVQRQGLTQHQPE
jgi:hypothetical protein